MVHFSTHCCRYMSTSATSSGNVPAQAFTEDCDLSLMFNKKTMLTCRVEHQISLPWRCIAKHHMQEKLKNKAVQQNFLITMCFKQRLLER